MTFNHLSPFTLACLFAVSFPISAWCDTFGSGVNAFDIDFVAVGNPGNPADTTGDPNPAGSVSYSFRMGKFEVSEQMIDKANVLGGLGLSKDTRGPDKPVTSVTWIEAARFVNWLNASSGSPLAYKFDIQPGEPGYNLFQNILVWSPGDPGYDPNNVYRNSLARYFLPSSNEWYKAAYFDPAGGVYYDYPTGSDSAPTPVASGTAAFTAVYGQPVPTGPADITQAGGLSPYGTMAQGGNVYEWMETDFDLMNGPTTNFNREIRGGLWGNVAANLLSSSRINSGPLGDAVSFGFRVASAVPEPSALLLAASAVSALLLRKRR